MDITKEGEALQGCIKSINAALNGGGDYTPIHRLINRIVKRNVPEITRYEKLHTLDDIVQEVSMKVWCARRVLNFDSFGRFCAYVTRCAKNAVTDKKRRKSYTGELIAFDLSAFECSCVEVATDNFDIVAHCERTLKEDKNATLNLFVQGYEYKEIAQLHNIPISKVKNRIHAQRVKFRGFLKNYI